MYWYAAKSRYLRASLCSMFYSHQSNWFPQSLKKGVVSSIDILKSAIVVTVAVCNYSTADGCAALPRDPRRVHAYCVSQTGGSNAAVETLLVIVTENDMKRIWNILLNQSLIFLYLLLRNYVCWRGTDSQDINSMVYMIISNSSFWASFVGV